MKKSLLDLKSKRFEKIISDIKSVKIQGATNVAEAGIKAYLLNPSKNSIKEILRTRPTEPLMQNALKILRKSKNPKKSAEKFLSHIRKSEDRIANYGKNLIKNNMNVFSHCHSSSVINILKAAKKQKKNFIVYTPEVEPLLQGRMTARELARAGIKVVVVPDLAAEHAIRKCNLFLFGADAYLKKGIVNKIGTSIFCQTAKDYNVPRYSCGISLKYTKKIKIENRNAKEVWDEREKNIEIENPSFDLTKKKFVSGVVSEFGILPYGKFISLAKKNLKKFLKIEA
jgi:ribose 1,5-bisphosphate isomerase